MGPRMKSEGRARERREEGRQGHRAGQRVTLGVSRRENRGLGSWRVTQGRDPRPCVPETGVPRAPEDGGKDPNYTKTSAPGA